MKEFEHIKTELRENKVLVIKFNRPEVLNAANEVLHKEMSEVIREFDRDNSAKVAVLTGEGRGFSSGGDISMIKDMTDSWASTVKQYYDANEIVESMVFCKKPVVSAINGPAVGAGLAMGLLADISVIGKSVKISDGHLRFGVAAGDHAVLIWPLLCCLSKAKYYLLTGEFIDGKTAEEIGLVTMAVDDAEVFGKAFEIASKLAEGSQSAISFTKMALNNWLKLALPSYSHSLALEMLGFLGPDAKKGAIALEEKRPPEFNR
jgi:enoyl-CoA hydratase